MDFARGRGGLTDWLDQAGRVPLLSAQEEIHLARIIQAGAAIDPLSTDPVLQRKRRAARRAADRFTTANLRLVYTVAKGYRGRVSEDEFLDLLQAGSEGLIKAVHKFDPERGYKFCTCAVWWIRDRLNNWLEQHSRPIRTPTTLVARLRRIWRAVHALRIELGREPTLEEVAARIGLSVDELTHHIHTSSCLSLDQHCTRTGHDAGQPAIGDTLAAPSSEGDDEPNPLALELAAHLSLLPELERAAIEAAFQGRRPSMVAYAKRHGLSKVGAANTLKLAIARLRLLSLKQRMREGCEVQLCLPLAGLPLHELCVERGRSRYDLKVRNGISRS